MIFDHGLRVSTTHIANPVAGGEPVHHGDQRAVARIQQRSTDRLELNVAVDCAAEEPGEEKS
jgi:hypothetical protein